MLQYRVSETFCTLHSRLFVHKHFCVYIRIEISSLLLLKGFIHCRTHTRERSITFLSYGQLTASVHFLNFKKMTCLLAYIIVYQPTLRLFWIISSDHCFVYQIYLREWTRFSITLVQQLSDSKLLPEYSKQLIKKPSIDPRLELVCVVVISIISPSPS